MRTLTPIGIARTIHRASKITHDSKEHHKFITQLMGMIEDFEIFRDSLECSARTETEINRVAQDFQFLAGVHSEFEKLESR